MESYNYHDVVLITSVIQTMELHFSVLYGIEKFDAVLSKVWDYVIRIDEKCEMKIRYDFFLLSVLVHRSMLMCRDSQRQRWKVKVAVRLITHSVSYSQRGISG